MDDTELWQRFTQQDLSHAEWDHVSHLRVAYLHLSRFDFDEAHLRLRAGIIRLNHRHGLEETSKRGYFETLSRVWLRLVAVSIRRCAPANSADLLERCPELLDRMLPLRHYSKELLFSTPARAIFVEPDLEPLPVS